MVHHNYKLQVLTSTVVVEHHAPHKYMRLTPKIASFEKVSVWLDAKGERLLACFTSSILRLIHGSKQYFSYAVQMNKALRIPTPWHQRIWKYFPFSSRRSSSIMMEEFVYKDYKLYWCQLTKLMFTVHEHEDHWNLSTARFILLESL